MTTLELYQEAVRRGLRLEQRGEMLAVSPAERCTSDFARVLLKHKAQLLALLSTPNDLAASDDPTEDETGSAQADERPHLAGWDCNGKPMYQGTEAEWRCRFQRLSKEAHRDNRESWIHVANQVLADEFADAARSTLESITIGLKATNYPACRAALEKLEKEAS